MAHQHARDDVVLERADPTGPSPRGDGTPTTVVRANRTEPPYVTDELVTALDAALGADFTLLEWDCDHMVPARNARRDGGGDPAST